MHRHGFQHVLDIVGQLLRILKAGGEDAVVDMDNLLKREALDVIGESPGLLDHSCYSFTSQLAFLTFSPSHAMGIRDSSRIMNARKV